MRSAVNMLRVSVVEVQIDLLELSLRQVEFLDNTAGMNSSCGRFRVLYAARRAYALEVRSAKELQHRLNQYAGCRGTLIWFPHTGTSRRLSRNFPTWSTRQGVYKLPTQLCLLRRIIAKASTLTILLA